MKLTKKIEDFLQERREKSALRTLKGIKKISASICEFRNKELLNFSSNDYLGLSEHPQLKTSAENWLQKFGTSFSASRLVCGTSQEIIELEEKIALWKGTDTALILGSGYLANCGAIPALANRHTAIFADKLNHASLNAGCLLSGAQFIRYRHCDMNHLEHLLRNSQADEKLIVSDTIFSMDGDVTDLKALSELAEKYDAILYLDDAHATGVFGDRGEGLASANLASPERLVIMGTFSKGMGAYGAYIAGSKEIIEYFINTCSSFIYSTALPPSAYGAIDAAIDLVQSSEIRKSAEQLLRNSQYALCELRKKGIDCGKSSTQIIPVIIGDNRKTIEISETLIERGILGVPIRPPTVPENSARIRFSINSGHSKEDIKMAIDSLLELLL